jgi:hypothetical protein
MDLESITQMTVWKRYGSTVMDRSNFTILDILDLADPVPVTYKAQDFLNLKQRATGNIGTGI